MKSLFAFDIDGTLYNSEKKILEHTKEALHTLQKEGHIVMIATGRSESQAAPIIKELNLDSYITCNGAEAVIENERIYESYVDQKELQQLIENHPQLECAVVTRNHTYRLQEEMSDKAVTAMNSFGEGIPSYRALSEIQDPICQVLLFIEEEEAKELQKTLPKTLRMVRWHSFAVDLLPVQNSKATALKEVLALKNIPVDHSYAFGDGNNDYEMLQTVGTGVAMGNAVERTKAIANYVTTSNDEDGIFHALKHFDFI